MHDVLTFGRCGVDIYPLQVGVTLEEVTSFGKYLGGTTSNVACAAARLGEDVATLTGVGDDPFGRWIRSEFERLGVATDYIFTDGSYNTPVTFCEIIPPEHFPFFFYRWPSAPDLQVTPERIPDEQVRQARLFWFSGSGLCQDPSWSAHLHAWDIRGRTPHSVFDLDWRPMFWENRDLAVDRYAKALEYATVAVGNREECGIAVGEDDPQRAADALLERGVELAIVKQGSAGTLAKTRDEEVVVPVMPATTMCGAGAGDAFGGSLIHGLLQGWGLKKIIDYANAAGAIVASRLECSTAMPTEDEIATVLDAGTADILGTWVARR
ncbi:MULTISPECIES: 5-dehydro-2-deoxygluconokinase [unclassified Actinobaculum]|uniref:5-dehydro-2-deoxygluconokinase n=1 Tax=unclassified Actinobaculum TaxID=2609299 RepID=UPI000D526719|nr:MULTISPECIES: 5-dehydro-2-deoxygluconokinase [unclassified Actinobaculum]AWE42408.1 5-dehydro-2-deoxygluconokinase [Actinobaculum sp. 313]RTE48393.1 5-dehydro-2-deoxygluconokinase [Actinobaculum sp. 352]